MRILAAKTVSDAAALVAIILAAGTTYDDPKSKTLTKQKNVLAPLWSQAEAFILKYAGKSKAKSWRMLKEWCDKPPMSESDTEDDWKYEDSIKLFANKVVATRIKQDTGLSDAEWKIAVSALAWANSGSNTAFLTMRKLGFTVGLPAESLALVAAESVTQQKPASELAALLKKNGLVPDAGQPVLRLSPDQSKAFKETKPKEWIKYDKLRKELLAAYKVELQNYCRAKGGPQPIDEVRRHMQQRGFVVTTLPEGFVGKIGDDGHLYTTTGNELNVSTGVRVQMNPKYDAKADNGYVFTYLPTPSSNRQFAYTLAWVAAQRESKFKIARELEDKLDKVQAKYRRDLRGTDPEKRTLATMLELQYITAMRIGNVGNATKDAQGNLEPTYGLSTLQVSQVKKKGAGLHITFPGKKGVPAKYTILPADLVLKKVVDNIKALLVTENGEPRPPKDYVFEDSTGRYTGTRVNKYLRSVSGIAGVTNHKIRHMRGTAAAREILQGAPKRLDQKAAETWFLESMTKVGSLLNHVKGIGSDQKVTPATAIKNYIDPELSIGFFKDRGLRIPKFLVQLQAK